MDTLANIIPSNIFSSQEFYQYIKKINQENQHNYNKYMIIACIFTFIIPLMSAIITYIVSPFNASIPPFQSSVFVTIIMIIVCTIPGLLYLAKRIEETRQTITPIWNTKYQHAWNTIISPEMVYSLNNFQKLSNILPESITKTPEYAQMYTLSEHLRQEIQQGPKLTENTNFDIIPNFIKLNNIMQNYQY